MIGSMAFAITEAEKNIDSEMLREGRQS